MRRYAFYDFEFGILKIGYTDTAIIFLKQADQIDADNIPSVLPIWLMARYASILKGSAGLAAVKKFLFLIFCGIFLPGIISKLRIYGRMHKVMFAGCIFLFYAFP